MILGIGTDIIKIERIKNNLDKQTFMDLIYTKNEQNYLNSKKNKAESAAGIFASKEAVAKALGTGIRGFKMTDIEIIKDSAGKPTVKLLGNAQKIADEIGMKNIMLSISHEKEYAIAFAITEN